jgi:hypothetical protein
MKKIKSRVLGFSFLVLFLAVQLYPLAENALAQVPDDIVVNLTVNAGITITATVDPVTMAPELSLAVHQAYGRSSFVVVTNDPGGYALTVHASTNPALASGTDSFVDYTEASAGVPETWTVASGAKEFGFSVYGTDRDSKYGTGNCDSAGIPSGSLLYEGFHTSPIQVATRTATTPFAGIETFICFRAQQNGVYASEGLYTATITGTATQL